MPVRELCQRNKPPLPCGGASPSARSGVFCSSSRRVRHASLSKTVFRKSRQLWYVRIDGRQINLGPDRDVAFALYRDLTAAPKSSAPAARTFRAQLLVVLCDRFLEWVQLHRSAGTYQWYWWRLQSFCRRYPELTIDELRPYHVQEWVDGQDIATTTQRNCLRAVKRSIKWAQRQGYIDSNPLAELESPGRREILINEVPSDVVSDSAVRAFAAKLNTGDVLRGCQHHRAPLLKEGVS